MTQPCPQQAGAVMAVQRMHESKWMVRRARRSDPYKYSGRLCSYCGSMHPDDFLRHLREGRVESTTKSYKRYVIIPNEKAGEWCSSGSSSGPVFRWGYEPRPVWGSRTLGRLLAPSSTLAEPGDTTLWDRIRDRRERQHWGPAPATQQIKFYTCHLTDAQCDEANAIIAERRTAAQ